MAKPLNEKLEAEFNESQKQFAYDFFLTLRDLVQKPVKELLANGYGNADTNTREDIVLLNVQTAVRMADRRAAEHLKKAGQ